MRTEFTHQDPGPSPHAYNDPDLSPIEFLLAVMHCDRLPMSTRIDAARGLLPYTEPRPACAPSSHVGCTIVIGGLGPCDPDPLPGSTRDHSQNPFGAQIPVPRDDEPGDPQNLTTTSYPPSLPNYSDPPTPAELQEIKAAINRLRPDLADLAVPEFRFCECGNWICGPCPLGERCREKSKLN
jgi:hypothetical protein